MTALSPEGAAFVSGGRVARLGTADARGRPLVVPVCYAYDGRRWYSAIDGKPKRTGDRALRRVRHIEANPRVAVLIDHYDEDWGQLRYVIIHGTAVLLGGGDEHAYALDLLHAKYPQYARVPLPGDGGVVIRVTPDSFVEWSYAA